MKDYKLSEIKAICNEQYENNKDVDKVCESCPISKFCWDNFANDPMDFDLDAEGQNNDN